MHSTTRWLALGLCAALWAGAAPAQNLLSNPDFDHDLAGWTWPASYTVDWHPDDELKGVGSMRLSDLPTQSGMEIRSTCIPLSSPSRIVWGASFRGLGGDGGGFGWASFRFFSNDDCTGIEESTGFASGDARTDFDRSTWGPGQASRERPAWAKSGMLLLRVTTSADPTDAVHIDNAFVVEERGCVETATTLCLLRGQFRVYAEWEDPEGKRGTARAKRLTSDSGTFWFFRDANVEMLVKVLNGCDWNDRAWVFAAGLTNVKVKLRVVDSFTGAVWERTNPLGQAFLPIQDTDAFEGCPFT